MMKFLTYEQFNESDISDIFRSAHAAINREDLIPLENLIGHPKLPSQEEFDEAVEYLGIEPEYIFYNQKDFLTPIMYWKGPVYYGFHAGLNIESFEMFHTKEALSRLTDEMNKRIKSNQWESVFTLADKKVIIPVFIEMFDKIPDNQKYDVFTDIYVRSEYGFGMFPKKIIEKLISLRHLSSDWKKRMDDLKKKMKLNADGTVTIYRGQNTESSKESEAYSWTLSKKTAEFFANRFNRSVGKIIRRNIDPKEILDFLEHRGESEVLINPSEKLALPIEESDESLLDKLFPKILLFYRKRL